MSRQEKKEKINDLIKYYFPNIKFSELTYKQFCEITERILLELKKEQNQ